MYLFCVVWADDTWLKEHAGETLETPGGGEQEDEQDVADTKPPAEQAETVSQFNNSSEKSLGGMIQEITFSTS